MAAETRIVEPEGKAVAREWPVNTFPRQSKHATTVTVTQATIYELLGAVFLLRQC
jgi:hypothetical protein